MAGGAVKRRGPGRSKHRPQRIVGDKAYSSRQIRQYVRRHGVRMTIPRKSNEHRTGPFDRTSYRQQISDAGGENDRSSDRVESASDQKERPEAASADGVIPPSQLSIGNYSTLVIESLDLSTGST